MYKGDISNKVAFGVGIDVEALVEVKPQSWWEKTFRMEPKYALNRRAIAMAEKLWRRDVRFVVYACGYKPSIQAQITKLIDDVPITRLVFLESLVDLGNHHLDETDIYFTVHEQFYFAFRFRGNVREFTQESDLYNWSLK